MIFVLFSTDSVPISRFFCIFVVNIKHVFFMAISFALGPSSRGGMAQIKVRVQTLNPPINIKHGTGLYIDPIVWKHRTDNRYMKAYMKNESVMKILNLCEEIRITLEGMFDSRETMTGDTVHEVIYGITNRDAIAAREAEERRKRIEEEYANRVTFDKFIDKFVQDVKDGTRTNVHGKLYASYSITNIQQSINQFHAFEKSKKREYDFDDINMDFFYQFQEFLTNLGKAQNTVGKFINWIKTLMGFAEVEGFHTNPAYRDKRFRGTRTEVDSIYLTQDDLDKIRQADLSELPKCYSLARDKFLIGVWTAQRVSDYYNIKKEDIKTLMEQRIEEKVVNEETKETESVIVEYETKILCIIQQKTGAKVYVPCSPELIRILEKYDYNVPYMADQKINKYIKTVAEKAELNEIIKVEKVVGGKREVEYVPKHKLVHTHTARRTGATLMYLSGMDIFDIMKITGHTTPNTLKKYIKADELDVVQKINKKYTYFR